MADDADLLITAGFSDAKLAQETQKVVQKYKQMGDAAEKAFRDASGAVVDSQKLRAHMREVDQLSKAYDPVYVATQKYNKEVARLDRALAATVISQDRYNAELKRAQIELGQASGAIQVAAQRAGSSGAQFQNVGYQIQDFAVQVASGTDASRAFAQQFPQMASAFGPWGVGIGTAAAVLVPLAAAMLGGADAGEVLDDKIEALTESTDSYVAAAEAARTSVADLTLRYGGLADEVARANAAMASIASIRAQSDAIGAARSLSGALGIDMSALSRDQSSLPAGANIDRIRVEMQALEDAQARVLDQMQDKLGATAEQADLLRMALNRTNSSNSLQAVAADAENLLGIVSDLYVNADEGQRQFLDGWVAQITATMNAAKQQIEAGIAEETRLIETYDQNSQKLSKLADDRKSAEAALAQAVIDGNQEKIDSYTRVLEAIDGEVVGIKTAIAELDGSLDAFIERMKSRAGQIGGTINDMVRSLTGAGVGGMIAAGVNAAERVQANQGTAELLKQFEGFRSKAYWDVNAYRAGFGSDTVTLSDGSIQRVTEGMTVTLEQANRDLERRIFEFQSVVIGQVGQVRWGEFNQGQQSALTSIAYNYGSLPDRILEAVRSGSSQDIANAIGGLAGDNAGINSNRRMREASAFGDTSLANDALSKQSDILKEQATQMQRKLDLVKQFGEQLSANLLTEQQTAELAKARADQIAAINAQDISDEAKAAAIAQVNAEMDRQTTILKLMEESKRRNVDLDAQMTGSTLTYRQAIEQLGEAQYAQSLANQEAKRGAEELSDAQKFAADQQRQLEEGFASAILSAGSFGDALKELAAQFAMTAAKAWLMKGLFNSGPLGGGGGGGLLGGIFGSLFPSANGNVFLGGSPVTAFANGGVVSGPTIFPMRNGTGLMGEAGPEAIMPLVRLPSGKLGVQSNGGGGSTGSSNVNLSIDLRGTTGDRELDAKMRAAGERILMQAKAQTPGWVADNQKRTG